MYLTAESATPLGRTFSDLITDLCWQPTKAEQDAIALHPEHAERMRMVCYGERILATVLELCQDQARAQAFLQQEHL